MFLKPGTEFRQNYSPALDVPPGPGLRTVTHAVPAVAVFTAGTVAVSCPLLTNVVASGLRFQRTTEPETKPVPFTVNVKSAPPGTMLVGSKGSLIKVH